jgi:hypothetical protein
MVNVPRPVAYFFGVFCPLSIFGLSVMAAIYFERNDFVSQATRDCAQFMYFLTTIIGLLNFSTETPLRNSWFTLDMLSIGVLALCCLLMSLSFTQKFLSDTCLAVIDIIANGAAFLYLGIVETVWNDKKKKNTVHSV